MSNKLIDKFLYIVGLDGEQSEEENMEQEEIEENQEQGEDNSYLALSKKKKIVNIHTSSQVKVFIFEPKTFEDAPLAVNNLKNRKPVILNLENLDKDVAKKTFDFLSGAVYAIDGNIQKINGNIFLLAPNNVDISANVKEDFKNKNLFPCSSVTFMYSCIINVKYLHYYKIYLYFCINRNFISI